MLLQCMCWGEGGVDRSACVVTMHVLGGGGPRIDES